MRAPLEQRITDAKSESVSLYIRRQTIGAEIERLRLEASQCDQAVIVLDGEIRGLSHALSLLKDDTHAD